MKSVYAHELCANNRNMQRRPKTAVPKSVQNRNDHYQQDAQPKKESAFMKNDLKPYVHETINDDYGNAYGSSRQRASQ